MRMLRITLPLLLAFVIGCSSSGPEMSGTWMFTLIPTGAVSPAIQATASLTQTGSQVGGPASLSGTGISCGTEASFSGTVKGNILTLQLTQLQSAINLTGTANQAFTSALGTYTATAGSCLLNGGTGTWSATLQ
jgi:hypothetical protein